MRERLERAITNAEIRITLPLGDSGTRLRAGCFTVDKNLYTLRLSDETESSVKVWIEGK